MITRYYFSIYDNVAESFAEPFPIQTDDMDKACKIAMRSVASQDATKFVIPVDDLSLYFVGVFENGQMAPPSDGIDSSSILVCHVSELFKKEVKDG